MFSLICNGHCEIQEALAVAVIADRTAYDVRYTGKLLNRFRLQVDERLVHYYVIAEGNVRSHLGV